MCDLYLDEAVEAYTHQHRKARKQHVCTVCRGVIKAGEKYHHTSWVFEGSASSEKECEACNADRSTFGADHDQTPLAGDFVHYLRECIAEGDDEEKWKPMLKRIESRKAA